MNKGLRALRNFVVKNDWMIGSFRPRFVFISIILIILSLLYPILSSPVQAQGEGVIPISNNLNNQLEPVIYSNYIVWTDYRNDNGSGTNSDIFLHDLTSHQEHVICSNPARQVRPDIYETTVSWEDNRAGPNNWDIYAYDISTGSEKQITTNPANQNNPAIYKNFIVWEDVRRNLIDPSRHDNDIYIYDMNNDEEYPLIIEEGEQIDADIYDNYVVWTDRRSGNPDIYLYDLSVDSDSDGTPNYRDTDDDDDGIPDVGDQDPDPAEKPLVTNTDRQHNPAIYKHLVVYQDHRNGNSDIFMYNLKNNTETALVTDPEEESLPRIHENYVVYEKMVDTQREIYYFDLTTSKSYQITYHPSNQEFPDIYKKTTVWADYRNDLDGRVTGSLVDNGDIYMFKIIPPSPDEHPPVVTDITAVPDEVEVGGEVTIIVEADDEDGDSLEFIFTFTSGVIKEIEDNKAIWEAPEVPGKYQISSYVSDGKFFSNTMTVTIIVYTNHQPEIINITLDPEVVKTGRATTIKVQASDPDGDKLVYEYISSKGKITGLDSDFDNEITWTAPDSEGEYQIIIKVSDFNPSTGTKLSTVEEIITITVIPRDSDSDKDSGFIPGFELGALELIIIASLIVILKIISSLRCKRKK